MDYTKKIFEYFSQDDIHRKLVIAPHAPPIELASGAPEVALNAVLDDRDVADTLQGLLNYGLESTLGTGKKRLAEGKSGAFCLSIPKQGRFRIAYLTQRGSRAITVDKIPFVIPGWAELGLAAEQLERMSKVLQVGVGGVLVVYGRSVWSNATVVYSLLQSINETQRRIIYIQERELSYLMRHESSVVIQQEFTSDCQTMEDGLRSGLEVEPNILYVGDLLVTERAPSLARAMETGAGVVMSLVARDQEACSHHLEEVFGVYYQDLARRLRCVAEVDSLDGGKLNITFR
jgi:twitching motility protein PilT